MKKLITVVLLISITQTGFCQDATAKKIDDLLAAYVKLNKFNGSVLVSLHSKIILKKGIGFSNVQKGKLNTAKTMFQIASVTKQFTSTVILKLVELKKMTLADKLSKYYPDFPNGERITIENLLTHTSGIYDYTHDDTAVIHGSEQKMLSLFQSKKLDFEPGTNWSYSNSGYSILGYIIGKVTGITYEQAVKKYIFEPLHMNDSGFDFERLKSNDKATGYSFFSDSIKTVAVFSDSSVVYAAGSIYSTVEDLYKWHQGLQAYKIVIKELMEKAYTPFKKSYGYGWIIDSLYRKKITYHSGGIAGFSSNFARIASDDVCIILLNNREGVELETITRKIVAILYNKQYIIPQKKQPITLPEEVLKTYTGIYELASPNIIIEVYFNNRQLMVRAVNGPTFELFAEKKNLFFVNDDQAQIEFVTNKSGKVDNLVLYQNDQKNVGKKIK